MSDTTRNHCAAMAEVMTPDAYLRTVACGKQRKGHGCWHTNRHVRWRGRWVRPLSVNESVVKQAEEILDE